MIPSTPNPPNRLVALLRQQITTTGLSASPLPGVYYMRTETYLPRAPVIYDPGICILASGRKSVSLGNQHFTYDADHFLALSVPLPLECEVFGSPADPVLGIRLDIDPLMVAELLLEIAAPPKAAAEKELLGLPQAIYASAITEELRGAASRLVECFSAPTDARILGPAIVREIIYRILCTDQAPALRAVAARHSHFVQISRSLQRIHADYAVDLSVDALASEAAMSPSSFHENFRAVTATSPLQYLKTIRLHKARVFMVQDGLGAAQAAAKVGYESASQFSREFKRLFGTTPVQAAASARATLVPTSVAGDRSGGLLT